MEARATIYEESLERTQRRSEGIYYTPAAIVDDMLAMVVGEVGQMRLCDPCCGGGNFLMGALRRGFLPENIYGYDRDAEAVAIACERIFEATGFDARGNIRVADFWDEAPRLDGCFDVVATNPPWGSRMARLRRCELAKRYGLQQSSDSASLMLMAALGALRDGGQMTILLPEAFFNIGGFEGVRRKVLELEVADFCDYERPFKGLLTRAQSLTLVKRAAGERHRARCRFDGEEHRRSLASFRANPKAIINMWLSAEGAARVEAIYGAPHTTLAAGEIVWGMGIVTGDNGRFCSATPREGYVGALRGYSLSDGGVGEFDTYISDDLSLYQQVAPREFYLAPKKIIYRFISNRLVFCLDCEQRYILNSINGFILSEDFPLREEEVVERLNSDDVRWLHAAIFRTHKILRGDIEQLPLKL